MSYKTNLTGQNVASFYCLIGEAIWMIQHLEEALSHSITIKNDVKYPRRISEEEAKGSLERYRSLSLDNAINFANNNNLYSDILYNDLAVFKKERDWLVHKLLRNNFEDMHAAPTRNRLFHRIKAISNKANMLQKAIEVDLIQFSEAVGMNLPTVHAATRQYFHED
ncbi:MAG: hypothetical protein WCE21_01460 [Candidatus Babeliales bacterium]